MLNRIYKKIGKDFFYNFLTLSAGNLIAALIVLLFSPLLTRIYSPENFGAFQIFFSLSSYFILSSCLRFEYALLSRGSNKFSKFKINLISFHALLFVVFISVLFCLICFYFDLKIYKSLGFLLFFLPLFTFFGGLVMLYTINDISTKKFKLLSQSKIAQNFSLTFSQISLGLLNFTNFGLFWSDLIGKVAFVFLNFDKKYFNAVLKYINDNSLSKTLIISKKYKSFPVLMLPSKFFNISATSIPIILIGNYFSLVVVGYYFLIDRIFAPITILVSEAISRVFEADMSKIKTGDKSQYNTAIYIILTSMIVLIPFIMIIPFSERIIVFVFGNSWIDSGIYYKSLLPMFILGIISNNLTNTLVILEKHKQQLFWDISRAIVVILLIIYFINSDKSAIETISVFSYSMACFYLVHVFLSINAIKRASK